MKSQTITLDNSFLDQKDHDYLAELIYDFLAEKEIFPQCIEDFKIIIDYSPENDNEHEREVAADAYYNAV